jgi:hypothetical protein
MKILLLLFPLLSLLNSCSLLSSPINRPIINSLEDINFPNLKFYDVEARVDTGATTSTLHASSIHYETIEGKRYVHFKSCHSSNCLEGPIKREVLAFARIKSSNGKISKRPIVKLKVQIKGSTIEGFFTLFNRSRMTYAVLIGRDLISGFFYVNPDVESAIEIP